jgi:hypothetical protein
MSFYDNLPLIQSAWIYIAIDARHLDICKVGITLQAEARHRVTGSNTANPFYTLFNSYDMAGIGISKKELFDFEDYLHRKIAPRIPMIGTGGYSEWIMMSPFKAAEEIEYRIGRGFSVPEFMNEDGEIQYENVRKYLHEHRPNPFFIAEQVNGMANEYVEYLLHWYEQNVPGWAPRNYNRSY